MMPSVYIVLSWDKNNDMLIMYFDKSNRICVTTA